MHNLGAIPARARKNPPSAFPQTLSSPRWDCDHLTNLRVPMVTQNRFYGPLIEQQGYPGHTQVFSLVKGTHVFHAPLTWGSQAMKLTRDGSVGRNGEPSPGHTSNV